MNLKLRFQPHSICLLCALTLTAGCQQSGNDASGSQESNEASIAAIEIQAKKFSAAYVSGNTDELLSIYTQNGVAAPSGQDFYVGREQMRPLWTIADRNRILRHKTTSESLVVDGDHAYDWGYYEGQSELDGTAQPPFSGKYVIVWEKGDDGIWRMAVDMWNSLPRPPGE